MNEGWKDEVETALKHEDHQALLHLAGKQCSRLLRYLSGRLCSADEGEKWRAVWGLGVLAGDGQLVSQDQATDLLRRFFWALNDESGAVPWGAPEAIGEILAVRPELRDTFLPMLCSLVTDEDMLQTRAIERGVLWALGRVGPPVARCAPEAVEALRVAAATHPDRETRQVAARSLAALVTADTNP
jgi:methylated-DNA-[protein]-cysteine S-methyltransferase